MMNFLRLLMFSAITTLTSFSTQALTESEIKHYTLSQVTVEEYSNEAPLISTVNTINLRTSEMVDQDPILLELDALINIGQKIWTIIEKGKPVLNVQNNSASAMPEGILSWNQLAGWKPTESKTFRITYKNLYGMNVVDFTYRLLFTYGGHYKGRGRFITGATIIPANVSVLWGFEFNSNVSIPTVVNSGTIENPIGGIQMNINWSVENVLINNQQTSSFFVDGLGRIKILK